MPTTDRHGFELWEAGFTQSDTILNDLLLKLDVKIGLSVLDKDLNAPAGGESDGDCYIIGSSPTGAWAAFSANDVVILRESTWYGLTPIRGLAASVEDESDDVYIFNGTSWTKKIGTEFDDSAFRIIDNGDNTKKIAFQASGITTGTVRTVTMPDEDVDLGALSRQYRGQNLQSDDYTLVLSDAGKIVEIDKATANTLTIPANSSVAFPVNTRIDVVQYGVGQTTIAITDDDLRGNSNIPGRYQMVSLWKRAATEWVVVGGIG